ncbi:hypothetical protein FH972_000144 [Carpinus fangiana]|uniref:Uncharacterized protein n=1 Tax=Carpinus fangiana TaxID=176857 RepID=A0A5N6Q7Y5_9ROSI|nr:hypothetical protein FH972_000144 [Carpinus fangiana]
MAEAYEGREMGSVVRTAKVYEAAIKKDWEALKKYCEEDNAIMNFPIMTGARSTVLHIAVYSKKVSLVRYLLHLAPSALCELVNERGDTVLHEAAGVGNVEMAKELIGSDKELLKSTNKRGETPLFRAAAFNQTEMVKFLASAAVDKTTHRTRTDGTSILHITVLSKFFDTALELLQWDVTLPNIKDKKGMTCFQLVANMPSAFKSGNPMNILEELLYLCLPDDDNNDDEKHVTSCQEDLEGGCGRSRPCQYFSYSNGRTGLPPIKRLWDIKKQQNRVLRLARILHVADDTWMGTTPGWGKPEKKDERSQAAPSFEPPIISAARNGIIEIVDLILAEYPLATEVVNDREENIFHVAARCRRKEILDRLEGLPPQLLRIGRKINIDGDSILHQAAYQDKHQLRDRPGEALHMQSEIQWFKRLHWAAVPIYTIACWPVTIFLVLQFGLYLNIAWFTVSDLMRSFLRSFIDSGH